MEKEGNRMDKEKLKEDIRKYASEQGERPSVSQINRIIDNQEN